MYAVGAVVGIEVGIEVGRLVGTLEGRLEDGVDVGRLVSPGFVGLVVCGALVGYEVGLLLDGIEVGALMIIFLPMTISAVRMLNMLAFTEGVCSKIEAPTSEAARTNSLAKAPDSMAASTFASMAF